MGKAYDVVIAGGGVNGCATAYLLAESVDFNGTVTVIERDSTYANAPSARATGGIRQQFSTPENIEIGLFGAHFAKHIADYLSIDGVAPEVGFREDGYLLLATPESYPIMATNNARQRELGACIELQTIEELALRFPWLNTTGLGGGCLGVSGEGWLDPYLLLQVFRAKARALGVEFLPRSVETVFSQGNRVTGVQLDDGNRIGAGAVVNAAGASGGAKLARSAGIGVPVESRKRFTFVFDTKEVLDQVPLTILPEGLAFRPEGTTYLSNLAPPPEEDPESFDYEIDYRVFEDQIWPLLAARVPAFEAIKLLSAWCCHYDLNTFDENAIVGASPELENFYLLLGFSGHGLQQSPAMGRATAELITFGQFRRVRPPLDILHDT